MEVQQKFVLIAQVQDLMMFRMSLARDVIGEKEICFLYDPEPNKPILTVTDISLTFWGTYTTDNCSNCGVWAELTHLRTITLGGTNFSVQILHATNTTHQHNLCKKCSSTSYPKDLLKAKFRTGRYTPEGYVAHGLEVTECWKCDGKGTTLKKCVHGWTSKTEHCSHGKNAKHD